MSKEKRNAYIEHKNKVRGSIRVWAADLFYETRLIDDVTISNGTLEARVSESCCTLRLRDILNKHGITHTPGQHEGTRLKSMPPDGLDCDYIHTIKNDPKYLRMRYSAWKEEDLIKIFSTNIAFLEERKISYGEPDGELVCFKGACLTPTQFKKKQKELGIK